MKKFIVFLFFMIEATEAKTLVEGHRGSRATHPENTLPAFQHALKVGADILELDLAMTKDGHLVVAHDPYINPIICLDPKGKKFKNKPIIYHMTLKEVQKYDCGSLVNPQFPNQKPHPKTPIPTFVEVLNLARHNSKIKFNVETKIFPKYPHVTPSPKVFVTTILKVIKKYKLEKRVILQSFDPRTLIEAKKQNPKIKTSYLLKDPVDTLKMAQSVKADIISPHYKWLTKKEVQRLHKKGIRVAPWTANTPKDWSRLLRMGVDSIITDDPARLINYLKRKKRKSR